MDAIGRESDSPKSVNLELAERRGVSSLSPRSPKEEAAPLKGSPVSVRLRPGVLLSGQDAAYRAVRVADCSVNDCVSRSAGRVRVRECLKATSPCSIGQVCLRRPVRYVRSDRPACRSMERELPLSNSIDPINQLTRSPMLDYVLSTIASQAGRCRGGRAGRPLVSGRRTGQPLVSGPARVIVILSITRWSRCIASR